MARFLGTPLVDDTFEGISGNLHISPGSSTARSAPRRAGGTDIGSEHRPRFGRARGRFGRNRADLSDSRSSLAEYPGRSRPTSNQIWSSFPKHPPTPDRRWPPPRRVSRPNLGQRSDSDRMPDEVSGRCLSRLVGFEPGLDPVQSDAHVRATGQGATPCCAARYVAEFPSGRVVQILGWSRSGCLPKSPKFGRTRLGFGDIGQNCAQD